VTSKTTKIHTINGILSLASEFGTMTADNILPSIIPMGFAEHHNQVHFNKF